MFVNPKQYDAIMRRRVKKMRQQKSNMTNSLKIKKKYKYETRSKHARNRKRAKDGKFLSATDNQDGQTVSTVLKQQEEETFNDKTPCCADEAEADTQGKKEIEEKDSKLKLELENMDAISMNSDELMRGFRSGSRRSNRMDHLDHHTFEEGPTLRHHDSLFDAKR